MNRAEQRRELRKEYIRDLFETLPTMELIPLPKKFLSNILSFGLIVLAGRQMGKTNVVKIILREIINGQNGMDQQGSSIQCKITDSAQNWMHSFEPIYYQHINDETVFPDDIYFGDEHFLYDIEYDDVELIQEAVETLVSTDYNIQRLYKKERLMDNYILWTIEEGQNVIGRYALEGKRGKRWLKIISESANFNTNFIIIGQRAADISAKAVERCQTYLFGKMTGDNDLKKVRRICGKDAEIHELVPKLKLGEFIYWNGDEGIKVINVPRYESTTKPVYWKGGMGI